MSPISFNLTQAKSIIFDTYTGSQTIAMSIEEPEMKAKKNNDFSIESYRNFNE